MPFIDKKYFLDDFGGEVPEDEICRLIYAASVVIKSLLTVDVPDKGTEAFGALQKATAYQVECLYQHGGIDALNGFAEGLGAGSESLGSYSVSAGANSAARKSERISSINGVPISPIAEMILRENGLCVRWAYSRFYRRKGLV